MGLFREILCAILALSLIVFIALFGRIPALRKTPIGFIYRVIWIHIPKALRNVDRKFLGGCLFSGWGRAGDYLMNENHPLVLVFFIVILAFSEIVFVPAAWPELTLAHRIATPVAVVMPYIFLYLSVTSPSIITAENHRNHMLQYPYDRIIFHPNLVCRTCRRIKPPRSKHCSICKGCVARHDHHCVWLKTCVGRNNYRYFLALLVSLSFLLAYGAYQGCFIIDGRLQDAVNVHSPNPRSVPHWSKGLTWKIWFEFWILALADDVRIGAVALLAALTTPLAAGMLAYHIYLIWAGTTTNESSKWGDWRDDISEGVAYMAKSSEVHKIDGWDDFSEPYVAWPKKSTHTLIYNVGGEPPKLGYTFTTEQNSISQPESPNAPIDSRWTRVQNLEQVINIYDLGFWDNLREALFGR